MAGAIAVTSKDPCDPFTAALFPPLHKSLSQHE